MAFETWLNFSLSVFIIILIVVVSFLLKRFIENWDIEFNSEQIGEYVNKQVENKLTGMKLSGNKESRQIEQALVQDLLNKQTNGLFSIIQEQFPTVAKKAIKIAAKNINFETGEITPYFNDLMDQVLSKLPTHLLTLREDKSEDYANQNQGGFT